MQTVVVIVDWLLPTSVHHDVNFVEAIGADEARDGAEMTVDAERVTLAVEVRQRQHDGHQPRRRDHFHRTRLACEDLCVDRVHNGVKPAHRSLIQFSSVGKFKFGHSYS